jgi:RNA polymerase sigma-70 factor (ECF subfamily)
MYAARVSQPATLPPGALRAARPGSSTAAPVTTAARRMPEPQADGALNAELLRRIAAQDREALAELYDTAAALLFSVSFRILGDAHETEEVIQEVFLQIWNKASTYDPALGTPLHWTLGIARNRSIDRLRSRQRRARMHEQFQQFGETEFLARHAGGAAGLSAEELAAVRAAVATLPADQRRALDLAFFGGLTHAEIADATGEPLGTVKARIRRAMLKLRDTLQAYA